MARNRRQYEDDDGRTVADMSGIERPSIFRHHRPDRAVKHIVEDAERKSKRPWEESGWNREERRAAMSGALASALLIAAAYILGLGALIALIYFAGKMII